MAELTETDRLCRQSIQKYLDVKGIPYERQGYYLRLRDHDSLVVDTRITKEKPYETFYWNSQAVGGNLYNFLRNYENMESKEAFDELKKMAPELAKAEVHEVKTEPYDATKWRGHDQHQQSKQYLVNQRGLNPKLVEALFKHGLVRELRNGDLFFSWRDQKSQEVGGDVQGTRIDHEKFGKRGTRKMIAKGSVKNFGFHFDANDGSGAKKLYVFESPIDALSFYNLHHQLGGDMSFISLNGAGTKIKTIEAYIKQFGVPDELHLAMDNDGAGFKGMLRAKKELQPENADPHPELRKMKILFDQPADQFKDWNDALKARSREMTSETIGDFIKHRQQSFGLDQYKQLVHEFVSGQFGNVVPKASKRTPEPRKGVIKMDSEFNDIAKKLQASRMKIKGVDLTKDPEYAEDFGYRFDIDANGSTEYQEMLDKLDNKKLGSLASVTNDDKGCSLWVFDAKDRSAVLKEISSAYDHAHDPLLGRRVQMPNGRGGIIVKTGPKSLVKFDDNQVQKFSAMSLDQHVIPDFQVRYLRDNHLRSASASDVMHMAVTVLDNQHNAQAAHQKQVLMKQPMTTKQRLGLAMNVINQSRWAQVSPDPKTMVPMPRNVKAREK
ncbi:toprim domain-containing protein [Limosilactobacillus mucosae]|uniref:toprim domain-containing protein n=1 Tax=Limosilactobacillus mucosae TaxID=97478 RepID=UPI000A514A2D|nr:toprim domain-containing protein [Limosilactobacillus mucosae]